MSIKKVLSEKWKVYKMNDKDLSTNKHNKANRMVVVIDKKDDKYAVARITSKSKKGFRKGISGFKQKSYVDQKLHLKKSNGKPIKNRDFTGKTNHIIKKTERSAIWSFIFSNKSNWHFYELWKNKKRHK